MIYEIVRKTESPTLVGLRFAADVPVEVRVALIGAGFNWINYSGLWVGLDRENAYIRALISAAEGSVKERLAISGDEEARLKDEYMVRIAAGESDRWRKYYEKEIGTLVRLTDGSIVNIEKPRIKTSFCFGESGYDAEDAARMANHATSSEDYFRNENLKEIRDMIDVLSRKPRKEYRVHEEVWVSQIYRDKPGIVSVHVGDAWNRWENKAIQTVSEEDRERLLEGYRKAYADFEKRINAYLKRYGLSKVRSWTYWRDA